MLDHVKLYLKAIERDLRAGSATEHSHRLALKALLEALAAHVVATNEPKRIACGAPDYVISREGLIVGYVEAKDVGRSLDEVERSEQLKRYLRSLGNLVLTDYLEFRWYVDGERRQMAQLARQTPDGGLKAERDGPQAAIELLTAFLERRPQPINTPKELAVRMARLTHIVRDMIVEAFHQEQASALLQGWRQAFAQVLIADLDQPEKTPEFADMFAQTLAYGLFTARVMDPAPSDFDRQKAQRLIPRSNPFLRDFFYQISGPQMDDEPFSPFVDDLIALLAHTDMAAVLADFGRRTRQQDPIVHFYETFLAAYDPRLRETRGVYYTPEPVVAYIVRSVDHLLKTHLDCPQGLADSRTVVAPNYDPGLKIKGKNAVRKTTHSHKVLVLDPACGTGTFLYAVIDLIREQFMQRDNAGLWPGYVRDHLLPRLFGFELLMAPYAVAHFKLSLQLAGRDLPDAQRDRWAYQPAADERLGIYLTNALEAAHEMTGLPLFTQWVADETNAANQVKRHLPIMVIMGNPPYSGHSANKGAWIDGLLKGQLPDGEQVAGYYQVDGQPLGERNPKWLQDDYVKFIRFAQWRIARTGSGILAFITNNGYLDNPTFRGMRQQLVQNFDRLYLLNLHGNARKKETAPDGSPDENVFDIQQGVAVLLAVKQNNTSPPGEVFYADLWGSRADKYACLLEQDVATTDWQSLAPQSPFYLFVPQDIDLLGEYNQGWKVTDILPVNSVGIVTARDRLTIHWTPQDAWQTVRDFAGLPEEEAQRKYRLGRDVQDWQVSLAQADIRSSGPDQGRVTPILYRPFDTRFTYYTGQSRGFICRPRPQVMGHMLAGDNLALITSRLTKGETFKHTQVTKNIVEVICMSPKTSNNGFVFPLYLYPTQDAARQQSLFDVSPWPPGRDGRVPNLNPEFVAEMERRLGMVFVPHPPAPSPQAGRGSADLPSPFAEEPRDKVSNSPSPQAERALGGEAHSAQSRPQDQTPAPLPPPANGPTSQIPHPPSPQAERGLGGEVPWRTPPDLWQKLKPLARQMRHKPTPAEEKLWQHLRNRQLLNAKFRRQHAIDRFIVDFYCREAQLIVEIDGPIHDYTVQEDALRQEFLQSQRLRVLRFTNDQVLGATQNVLDQIAAVLQNPPSPQAERRSGGEGANSPSPQAERELKGEVQTFTPEDILHYTYALFHAPTYRERYAEFLKIDFPRLPLTSDPALFRQLCDLGRDLVALHLLETPPAPISHYPVGGDNRVTKGHPRYAAQDKRVYINRTQYFADVPPAVWEFCIGGYQVCHKWLRDRQGRQLSYQELQHYQNVVVALHETIRLMEEIDRAIPDWPLP